MPRQDSASPTEPEFSHFAPEERLILLVPAVLLGMLASSLLYCGLLTLGLTTLTPSTGVRLLLWVAVIPFTWRFWQITSRR